MNIHVNGENRGIVNWRKGPVNHTTPLNSLARIHNAIESQLLHAWKEMDPN